MTEDLTDGGNSLMMIRHKVVFVGDVSVGKTSVMCRFIENKFNENYDPTIGVDFYSKNIYFKENTLKLQIWDSAGQERYKSLIPSYVRGASIIFILFDLSKKESFESVPNWINFIKNVKVENTLIILCGNKLDLPRQVSNNEPIKLAEKEGLLYFELSAKTNENVLLMFYSSIAELPFFEQYDIQDKNKLIQEIREGDRENSTRELTRNNRNTKKQLDVKNAVKMSSTDEKNGCKC